MEKELSIENIKTKIFTIRNKQVILDRDLAQFYRIETRILKQAVNRNLERFPSKFMYELNKEEVDFMVSQYVIPSKQILGGSKPYAFTEQGVAMLSAVLHSKIAIQISIEIINAFVLMRKFLLNNKDTFKRLEIIETKLLEHDNNFTKLFNSLESSDLIPTKGVFFEGELFDSHKLISDLIKSAKTSIKLIDNFIDDRTLNLFTKRKENVEVIIYTNNINSSLKQDLKKYNSQYKPIQIKEFDLSHDRFLIIDEEVYHIGASLKDLGKKWFAFSKIEIQSLDIINRLE